MARGKFITIEGVEGVGKSTAVGFLQRYFARNKLPVLFTREPGGTPNAEAIRRLLLGADLSSPHADTELLLMFASRVEHVHQLIMPALENDTHVVSDRFYDASYAYQGAGRCVGIEKVQALKMLTLGALTPHLTILLDAPLEVCFERIRKRKHLDRIEQEDAAFFQRVREQYLQLAAEMPHYVVIDASAPLIEVEQSLTHTLDVFFQHQEVHGG
jgi:dTMP kinase